MLGTAPEVAGVPSRSYCSHKRSIAASRCRYDRRDAIHCVYVRSAGCAWESAFTVGDRTIYPPWAVVDWTTRWGENYPKPFAAAHLIMLSGFLAGMLVIALGARRSFQIKPFGKDAWALSDDVKSAGLFANTGSVLGKFEVVAFDGPEHQLLIGASRSGKGRGHVVPTLLATPHSMLVLDVKGELADGDPRHGFPGTAGFRETLGPVLRFAPTRADSLRFNPIFEIPRGPDEVRWAQN